MFLGRAIVMMVVMACAVFTVGFVIFCVAMIL